MSVQDEHKFKRGETVVLPDRPLGGMSLLEMPLLGCIYDYDCSGPDDPDEPEYLVAWENQGEVDNWWFRESELAAVPSGVEWVNPERGLRGSC